MIDKAKFESIMQQIKDSERDELNQMPELYVVHAQTSYLLGYARCWLKVKQAIEKELSAND